MYVKRNSVYHEGIPKENLLQFVMVNNDQINIQSVL